MKKRKPLFGPHAPFSHFWMPVFTGMTMKRPAENYFED
jgi:hypothetical protein